MAITVYFSCLCIEGQKCILKIKGHTESLCSATLKCFVFFILCIIGSKLSSTSVRPQSPNPNHSGAALTTTASLKKKHDQHYLYKDQQQQQQVCPHWLRGTIQNEKSVFSSLISPDRGHESGRTLKTDEQVNRVNKSCSGSSLDAGVKGRG